MGQNEPCCAVAANHALVEQLQEAPRFLCGVQLLHCTLRFIVARLHGKTFGSHAALTRGRWRVSV